jgi:hypothetical protein
VPIIETWGQTKDNFTNQTQKREKKKKKNQAKKSKTIQKKKISGQNVLRNSFIPHHQGRRSHIKQ